MFRNLLGGLSRLAPFIPGMQAVAPWLGLANFAFSKNKRATDLLGLLGSNAQMFNIKGGELGKIQNFLQTPEGQAAIAGMRSSEDAQMLNTQSSMMQKMLGNTIRNAYNLYNSTDFDKIDNATIEAYDKVYGEEANNAIRDLETGVDDPYKFDLNRSVQRSGVYNDLAEKKAGVRANLLQSRPFRQQQLLPNLSGLAGAFATSAQYDAQSDLAQKSLYEDAARLNRLSQARPNVSLLTGGLPTYRLDVSSPSYRQHDPLSGFYQFGR